MSEELVTRLAGAVVLAMGFGAAAILRTAWTDRTDRRPLRIVAGWALMASAVAAGASTMGPARGLFIALSLVSVGALIRVAWGVELRQPRARGEKSLAPEPSDRASRAWRGWLRVLLAGPMGMVASMGVAICFALWAPGEVQTRLVIGGLMVPALWGGAMAWTLADDKILRATAVLAGVSIVTFTAAALRGI